MCRQRKPAASDSQILSMANRMVKASKQEAFGACMSMPLTPDWLSIVFLSLYINRACLAGWWRQQMKCLRAVD